MGLAVRSQVVQGAVPVKDGCMTVKPSKLYLVSHFWLTLESTLCTAVTLTPPPAKPRLCTATDNNTRCMSMMH